MSLALFDLDNTLIAGDSDHAWGEFLVQKDLVDPVSYKQANDQFLAAYQAGNLDIHAYLTFTLEPLTRHTPDALFALRREFVRDFILPLMLPRAQALLDEHRQKGDELVIITATNRFITAPIAELLEVPHLISVEPEFKDGRYTGRYVGIPTFAEGKVTALQDWLQRHNQTLNDSYFYSDSINDLPLLQQVSHPVAVDPDPRLRAIAEESGWPIISLRD